MRAFISQAHQYCAALMVASIATLAPQSARAMVLYSNNFDSTPTVAAGVSATLTPGLILTSIPLSPSLSQWWTGNYYANQTLASSILSLTGAVPAGPVDIDFTLGFLGSWDSSDGEALPDYLKISINGSPVLTELTTNNALGTVQNYGGGTVVGKPVIATTNYLHFSDTIVNMSPASSLSFNHPGGTLKLEILGYGGGYTPMVTWPPNGVYDEGWGIDNLVITSNSNQSVPAPLPLLGAASAYRFSRRLKDRIRRGN